MSENQSRALKHLSNWSLTLTTLTEFEERSLKTSAQVLFLCHNPSSFKWITVVLSVPDARAMCNLLHAKKKMLSAKIESGQRAELRGWEKVFVWRVMAPKFAVWRVIEPKLSAWRGIGHHNVMRDLLFCKCVMRDLQDFLLEFRDRWTPFDLEGYQSSTVNRVLTKIHKTWHPCYCFLVFSVLCWPMLDLWCLWFSWQFQIIVTQWALVNIHFH